VLLKTFMRIVEDLLSGKLEEGAGGADFTKNFFQELIFGKRAKMVDGTLGSFVVREEEREMT